uniref:TctD-like protein n=1 Tax=Leiomenia cribrosa TaxID=217483 RepID=A0A4D6WY98_9FLOR|nr:hypothetical protein [Leiomenia cribrosa]
MKKQLLLVDDDLQLRNVISEYLNNEGFCVNTVSNAYSALMHIKLKKTDLIISDIMMPGLNGHEFIQILRLDNDFKNIPLVFLTAKGMTEDRIRGYDLGCNAYLTKPFDPCELLAIINNIISNIDLSQIVSSTNKQHNVDEINNTKFSINDLTYRELTILQLVAKGYRNKDIAQYLNFSIRNIEKYVSRLLNKTSTRNRTELAQLAIIKKIEFNEGE